MDKLILVHVTGGDKPGLTAALTGSMAEFGVDILDMGQVVIHDFLTLGILIRLPESREPVLKDLLFLAHELGVSMKLHPLEQDSYESWVNEERRDRWIVTLLSRAFNASQVSAVAEAVQNQGLNIESIKRLSGRVPLTGERIRCASLEMALRGTPEDIDGLRAKFLDISGELGVDIALQADNAFRRNRRMVAFDMDSTLIQAEVIDELAKEAGVGDEVSAITESAMRGELDFKQSLRRRLKLLQGLDESVMARVAERIPLTEGAEQLIRNLKRAGYTIAILSGGFTYFGKRLQEKLDVDYVHANELEIVDGKLTGNVIGDIVDAEKKAELLTRIAETEGIHLRQVIAVGDGANDLPMLGLAGLGIAFHAKPKVKRGARQSISTLGLDAVLYMVGMQEADIVD